MSAALSYPVSALKSSAKSRAQILILEPDLAVLDYLRLTLGSQYSLSLFSEEQVLLDRRPQSVSQMPGMWELPEIAMEQIDQERIELTLRHAITVTNYYVRVLRLTLKEGRRRLAANAPERKWVTVSELRSLPLTGLARKILQRLKVMPIEKILV